MNKIIYVTKNEYEQAKLVATERLNYFKRKQNLKYVFISSMDLASLLVNLPDLKAAKSYIDQSYLLLPNEMPLSDGFLRLNCGYWIVREMIYYYLGQDNDAISSITQGIEFAIKLNDNYDNSRFLSNFYGILGEIKADNVILRRHWKFNSKH